MRGRHSTLTLWWLPAGAWTLAAGPRLVLHGRGGIWCFWSCFCVAGAAFGACGRCNQYERIHAILISSHTPRTWSPLVLGCFCMASATLAAAELASAWQAQHLVLLELLLRGRCKLISHQPSHSSSYMWSHKPAFLMSQKTIIHAMSVADVA